MKTRVLTIVIIVVIAGSLTIFSLNYHFDYDEIHSAYLFCERILFSGKKSCSVIWQEYDCPGGGCLIPPA